MKHLSLSDIKDFTTPFYLFDIDHLNNQISCVKNAFNKYWNNYAIAYSVKTNSLPSVCKQMLSYENVMAEVVSEDEYDLVRNIGFESNNIVCNGPVKRDNWLNMIINSHSLLNIDSKSELLFLHDYALRHPSEIVKVGIRINNNIENLFPNASTAGTDGSRFGFSSESGELSAAINLLSSCNNIKIVGLHLHTSTNLRSIEIYEYICERFCDIQTHFCLDDIEYFDVGGGFYGEISEKPQWNDYIKAISLKLKKNGYCPEKIKLIIEPGVSLLSGCFSYYTRVIDVKDTAHMRFVQLDGSRLHVDPWMHKTIHNYFYSIEHSNSLSQSIPIQTLVGNTCLEYDKFFTLLGHTELSKNDLVRFDRIGAYTITLSPLFITWFPKVFQISGNNIDTARGRWTTKELLQKSNI